MTSIASRRLSVIQDPADFDERSGSLLERLLFNHRRIVLVLCALVTGFFAVEAGSVRLNASFDDMIPTDHPFILNYRAHRDALEGLGNSVRIAVEARQGTIFDGDYLDTLKQINDKAFFLPGVQRSAMKSLWTPATRWTAVTQDGLDGGPVIPDDYDGSPESRERVRVNVERSGEIGQLVAPDFRSSVISLPLLDLDPATGRRLDYAALDHRLEALRGEFAVRDVALHITGFAKVAGDLLGGMRQIVGFFVLAIVISAAVLFAYTRCARSTALVVACSLVAVVWQLGVLPTLGYALDPYSILVPFLIFAIGMSHGAQKMNGIMQDIGRGTHRLVAARHTFRRLFLAGFTALLCDAIGFAILLIIPIRSIQDLALIASTGVAALIVTNLILLPVVLSYLGVGATAARRSLERDRRNRRGGQRLWRFLDRFTRPRWAAGAIGVAVACGCLGAAVATRLQIGDLDPGAPELRADSRYNRDAAFMREHYAAGTDLLAIMAVTPPDQCARYDHLVAADRLEWRLRQLPGVMSTVSLAQLSRFAAVGYNEGAMKWYGLPPTQGVLNAIAARAPRDLFSTNCDLMLILANLADHKARTLTRVVDAVRSFQAHQGAKDIAFLLGAGTAGFAAATNIVVERAFGRMAYWVYAPVTLLCLLTFRSLRATLCAIIPLILTSVLCEVLMVALGIGVKVATLPVIALGVGIGVDYALYVLSVVLARVRQGESLSDAYRQALEFTGRVVLMTGATLALGVATWSFSSIKFQADMGILLAFMFLWNMVGALVLLPALCRVLLPRPGGRRSAGEQDVLVPISQRSPA